MQHDYETDIAREYRLRDEAGRKLMEKFGLKFIPGISGMLQHLFGEQKTHRYSSGEALYANLSPPMQRKIDEMIADAYARQRFLDELVQSALSGNRIEDGKKIKFGDKGWHETTSYDGDGINWGDVAVARPKENLEDIIVPETDNPQVKILKIILELEKYSNRALIEQNSALIKKLFIDFTNLKISEHSREMPQSIIVNMVARLKKLQATVNNHIQGEDEVHNFSTILTNMIQTLEGLVQNQTSANDLIDSGRMRFG